MMFIDCLLLSKTQTFHIHILLLSGDQWSWETGHGGCIPKTPNKLKHLCVGDISNGFEAPLHPLSLAHLPSMSLFLQCGTFTCPSTSGKPRGQDPSTSAPCPVEPTVPSLPLLPLPCSLWVLRENNWPQAHGECLVPCSAPTQRSLWVGLSVPLLLLLVPGS